MKLAVNLHRFRAFTRGQPDPTKINWNRNTGHITGVEGRIRLRNESLRYEMELVEQEPVFVPPTPEKKSIKKFRCEINRWWGINLVNYRDLHTHSVHPNTIEDF